MSHRILLVDDDESLLQLLTYAFRQNGYEVECASDGQAGWRAARQNPPDLLITDLDMPEMDGLGLMACLRSFPATAEVPTVVVSGLEFLSSLECMQDHLGIVALVSKPVDPQEMLALARQVLASAATAAP